MELDELSSEWNRVLYSTVFNGRKVFSATERSVSLQAGVGADSVLTAAFGSGEALIQDDIRRASTTSAGAEGNNSSSGKPSLSADGRYLAFQSDASNLVPGDTNGEIDIFIKDLQTGNIARVSTGSLGGAGKQLELRPGSFGGWTVGDPVV